MFLISFHFYPYPFIYHLPLHFSHTATIRSHDLLSYHHKIYVFLFLFKQHFSSIIFLFQLFFFGLLFH
ncbi:hypothetical protein Lalb_Chr05g0222231 [Lupinus albus]|uniref:Uncharacterized protein n=1 Tax=Lupinus albus TaxID=3870 RepID=A0A6A4QIY4_LUPAL|nr:hypothetical protein Lalb_Chr05g0222231 [Lupinus albus]